MTVQAANSRADYQGNSVTQTFAVSFNFFLPADLRVILTDSTVPSAPVVTILALGTDYTVAGGQSATAGLSGPGSITTVATYTSAQKVSILLDLDITQLTHYVPGDAFPAASHENALDKLTLLDQMLSEEQSRALSAPPQTTGFNGTLPTVTPSVYGYAIGLNADGTGLAWVAMENAQQIAQLGDTTNPVNGSGMIGHNDALAYAAGTAGYAIKQRATLTAVAATIVAQTAQAYVTGGTGSAYTLTPTPALAANAQWVRYHCEFWAAGVGSPTMAVSGRPALPLMAYNSAGVLVPYLPAVGQFSDIECDGTNWIVLDPLPAKGTHTGPPENLVVTYGQNSGIVTVTCSSVTVSDVNGNQTRLTASQYPALANGTLQANLATINAINGTDGSTLTVGNMFVTFITFNPVTNSIGLVISAEPTSATTPVVAPASPITGYTQHKAVSANKMKASGIWLPGVQNGMEFTPQVGAYLTAMVPFVSGTIGTWSTGVGVAETVRGNSSLIPYHAGGVTIASWCQGTGCAVNISPNSNCGAPISTTNPPLFSVDNSSTAFPCVLSQKFNLESNSLYVSSVGAYTFLAGWTLNL